METKFVYVAVIKDEGLIGANDVITVQTNFEDLELFVKDWFGINETKQYTSPSKYLGFKKYNYLEHEDDLLGYFTFNDYDDDYLCVDHQNKQFIWCENGFYPFYISALENFSRTAPNITLEILYSIRN